MRLKRQIAILVAAIVLTAAALAQTLPPGVYIAMNGQIFDPATCRKNHDSNCFEKTG